MAAVMVGYAGGVEGRVKGVVSSGMFAIGCVGEWLMSGVVDSDSVDYMSVVESIPYQREQ